jgi:hypothetical protein
MPTGLLVNRLTALKMYLDSESLSVTSHQRAVEYQVRAILTALNNERKQDHAAILDELRRLGLDDLIAVYRCWR